MILNSSKTLIGRSMVISTLEEEKKHSARAKPTTGSSGRGVLSE